MRIIIILLLVIMAFSCKTVKEVVKVETRYDSTAINENKQLRLFLSEEIERFEKDREAWENTGVTFYNPGDLVISSPLKYDSSLWGHSNTPLRDPCSLCNTSKIIFDNGKIKSIEGRVKSLNQSLYEKSSELLDAHSTIDSMGVELEKKEVELSKKEKVLVKEVTRTTTPWWLFALCIVIGWIGRGYWPRVKTFIIKKGL